jgi:hypothetical protein
VVWIVFRLAMEKQDAGLCGDRDPDLVGDLLAAASLEVLLRQEHLDVPDELLAVLESLKPVPVVAG